MQYLKSLWNGELALWKSFWVFGVVVLFALNIASSIFLSEFLVSNPSAGGFFIGIYVIIVWGYTGLAYVGIWRSANKYNGFQLWAYAAKLRILLNIAAIAFLIYQMATTDRSDPGKDSGNIASHLQSDEKYPYVGFWKGHCSDGFGLAIDKVDDGLYSVSFCGPGGCFKPGTYRPNTTLEDDEDYRVIDENTIEVRGADGFSTYFRCEN